MKWGVRYRSKQWWVYEVATGEYYSAHTFELMARRKAKQLNQRGV